MVGKMPKVWHLSLEEAEAALASAGIPHRISRAQSRVVSEGHLVSVVPVPGTVMQSGTEAVLTVSLGPAAVRDRE
jgi:beta-lactam-binding protein with PASTA domain